MVATGRVMAYSPILMYRSGRDRAFGLVIDGAAPEPPTGFFDDEA
jgi:hypothetical protein